MTSIDAGYDKITLWFHYSADVPQDSSGFFSLECYNCSIMSDSPFVDWLSTGFSKSNSPAWGFSQLFDLSSSVIGRECNIYFRFKSGSSPSAAKGIWIDDVIIKGEQYFVIIA